MEPLPPLETFLRENLPLLCKVVRDCGTPEERVEEVVQDVLVAVHASIPTFDPSRGKLSTWLGAVARNVAFRAMREDYARAACVSQGPVPEADEVAADSEEQLIQRQEEQFVLDTLAQMPPELRAVVEQRDFHEMSWEEIARLSGVALSTLRSRREKALDLLRDAVHRRRAQESRRAGLFALPFSISDLLARARERRNGALGAASADAEEYLRRMLIEHETYLAGEASRLASEVTERARPGSRAGHRRATRTRALRSVALFLAGGALGGALMWFALRRPPSPEPSPPTPIILTEANRAAPPFAPTQAGVSADATSRPLEPPNAKHLETAPGRTVAASSAPLPRERAIVEEADAKPAGEADLLVEAQKAFAGGDFARARVLLERHGEHFPNGRLAQARAALQARLPTP